MIEYYGHDALGSVRIVFTASGVATARADYEPFGEGVTIAGMPAGPLPAQQFTGQERDALERQDYFGARYYRPRHGRFAQVDPVYAGLFDPQQWNRYAYARNNPLSFVDPDGRAISCYETGRGVRCNEDLTVTPESGSPHGPPLVLISGREPDCVPGLASRACGFVKNPVRGQPDPGDRRRRNREILVPLEPTPTDHDGAANSGGNSSGDGGANSTIDILLAMVEGFVVTTLDTSVRLCRYMFEECWTFAFGERTPAWLRHPLVNTALAVGLMLFFALSGTVRQMWPVFGAGNQLIGALSLITVTVWLAQRARQHLFALLPAAFMVVTTFAALLVLVRGNFGAGGNPVLGLTAGALFFLAVGVVVVGVSRLARALQQPQGATARPVAAE